MMRMLTNRLVLLAPLALLGWVVGASSAADLKPFATYKPKEYHIDAVAFSPDGKTLAAGCLDSTVRLLDSASGDQLLTFKGHKGAVTAVQFSPDGGKVASGGVDNTVRVWSLLADSKVVVLKGYFGVFWSLAFSPDGKRLAARQNSRDPTGPNSLGIIKLWNLADASGVTRLQQGAVNSLAFSPDGKTLATGGDDKLVTLWDGVTCKRRATFKGHKGPVLAVAYHPNGKTIASYGGGFVYFWDVATQTKTAREIKSKGILISAVALSPNLKLLALADDFEGNSVKLIDTASATEKLRLTGFGEPVRAVTFSPDGKTLATLYQDGTLKLWR